MRKRLKLKAGFSELTKGLFEGDYENLKPALAD